jgi:hypothetical protein
MRTKPPASTPARTRRPLRWDLEVISWTIVAGILLGLAAELYSHIVSVLWMTGGGLLGVVVGAICDTALFLFRRYRQKINGSITLYQ